MTQLHLMRPTKLVALAALISLPMLLGNEGCDPPGVDTGELCEANDNAYCPGGRVCTQEYAPVCGTDGRTYGNRCHAESADVAVAHEGPCRDVICGGFAGIACPCDMFCDYPIDAMCGAADQTGICRTRPQACPDVYQPVCGCDGVTYGNACEARAAGMSVIHEGACETTCGGLLGIWCPRGQFCDYPIETMCGSGDQTGQCRVPPEICTREYAPVCGCDGVTYGNACEAASASASVVHTGACESVKWCGGIAGITCPSGQFCDYPIETMCGAGDQTGECRVPPDACTLQYDPVCGCDGKTYSNACHAAAASMSVVHTGACGSTDPARR